MPIYHPDSLEQLRQSIDLIDLLESHIDLKRAGAVYKALCPFHEEKTPSFMVKRGDSHYHCFGCGAHGDAIQFMMSHLNMGFGDAIEALAERFNVVLQTIEEKHKGPSKAKLKEALAAGEKFFHFFLMQTQEGHEALQYLFKRGIDLHFIRSFRVGLAPKSPGIFRKTMHEIGVKNEDLVASGLLAVGKSGGWRDFFVERIVFPILDPTGNCIGFSGRKYKESTFGPKYVNTPETPLFKKSRVLFGLPFCRKRIAKEQKAIIVEGQIDALKLIHTGLNLTVAGQGTAFGEGHVKELKTLGVSTAYLALDGDDAGFEACYKIGELFQKVGIAAKIVPIPAGGDPDSVLAERGIDAFISLVEKSVDYLPFLINYHSRGLQRETPQGKSRLVQLTTQQIRNWDNEVMVHESLRKLASILQLPEEMVGVGEKPLPNLYIRKTGRVGLEQVDPDKVMEGDFLRWLLLMGESRPHFFEIATKNIESDALRSSSCQKLYQALLTHWKEGKPIDLISLTIHLGQDDGPQFIEDLLEKRVNKEAAERHFLEAIEKVLCRNWMEKREEIKMKIQSGQCTDEEALELAKAFDSLRKEKPEVKK